MSTAYHQKVAKDRATKEGIVVNPPELGNLPGQGEVTYASQVQDVLITYTTREDTYNYYEERNYVNDVNREHTEVLETYDHDGKARETYSYGQGRASYLNNQTGDSYNYLTNQSGSVTGLTKDGQAVASSSYNLYGARKTSTDTTGNPFAYNGEARDDTGLDYLRARYYDSQGGTFLTEDSYPGEGTDPLSQNRYSYVQNNPVNYTDPSGHFWNSIKKGWNYVKKKASNAWNGVKRVASNTWNTVKRVASNTWNGVKSFASKAWNVTKSAYNHATNWVSTQYNRVVNWGSRQWNKVQTAYNSASDYVQHQYQLVAAQIEAMRQQVVRSSYALATGIKSSPSIREGLNLYRNWNTALENTLKHVCDPKTTGASDKGENKVPSVADFRKYEEAARYGLTVSEKANIDSNSLSELKNKYGNVLGNYNTYQGTGYFNPQGSPINRYIISRYEVLKAIEDDKVAQKVAEMNKYHYTNLYEHIAKTGYRIDGTPASDIEKAIAPYVPWIAPIQDVTAAIAGRQVAKYNSSVPTGNGKQWSSSETVQAPKADVVTTKPTGGRLPMTVDNLQMFAEKPKVKPDFYVNPDGTVYKASDIVEKPSTLYHYTSEKGLAGILDTGTLNPSLKANNPKDARYGNGQYFSDIAPGTRSNASLSKQFINNPWQGSKYSNYIGVDTSNLTVVKGRDGVYVLPNENPLDLTDRIVSHGKN